MNANELLVMSKNDRRNFWKSVECIPGCGNCCGKCHLLTQDKKCSVHPSLPHVGSHLKRAQLGGSIQCKLTPIEVFVGGCFCPAIINVLQPYLDFTITPYLDQRGTISMLEHDRVFSDTRRIRGYED